MKYFYIIMGAFLLMLIGSSVYKEMNKGSAKAKRLDCQKEVVFFEKANQKKELIQQAIILLKEGKYTLVPSVKKSQYMQTRLFKYVNTDMTDKMIKEAIKSLAGADMIETSEGKNLKIKYLVYENDKDNPGKKTKKSKLYAGYLLFEFLINNEKAYQTQVDFMDLEGKDIEKRIQCTIKSLITLK